MNTVLKETIKSFIKTLGLMVVAMWIAFVPVMVITNHPLGLVAAIVTIIIMLGVVFWLIYQEKKREQ